MKNMWLVMTAVVLAGAGSGCGSSNIFDYRYVPDRATFGEEALPVPPAPPPPHMQMVNPDPVPGIAPTVVDQVTGTWTFVTPPTVTRVEHKTQDFSQFSLYSGRPAQGDTPFAVITVSREAQPFAESDPEMYKVTNSRVYALNGNVAQEWSGNTRTGQGFCELVIRKPGDKPGDICHAIATVRNAQEQKVALDILGSIKWTPNSQEPAPQ